MSGVLHGVLSAITAARDAFFEYVTLLLHGDGTNGAQNNTFLDGSTNNFTITRNGNTTQGSFSPFSQTGWSNYFDGTGDSLSLSGNSAFSIATSTTPFTIEGWVYISAAGGCLFSEQFTGGSNSVAIAVSLCDGVGVETTTGRFIGFGWFNGTAWTSAAISTTEVALNTWTHVACVFTGSTTKIYLNGVDSTKSSSPTPATTWGVTGVNGDSWFIGRRWSSTATEFLTGYISNLRFVNGTAVYTSAFTPPTAPLTNITNTSLLTCQSNRFIDNSSNAFTITRNGDVRVEAFSPFNPSTTYSTANVGGSGYFDGNGDELNAGSNAAFSFGTGAYTVEAWVYLTAAVSATHQPMFVCNHTTNGFTFWNENTVGQLQIASSGIGAVLSSATTLSPNIWNHIVAVRSGTGANQTAIFVNGTRVANGTDATNWSITGPLKVGGITAANYYLTGYASNVRVVKGTAVYDPTLTTLTVPTAPLTAITNTSLLLNFTNGGIFDNASQTVLETVGNAQISTAQSKFGGGSMYFDGTGDWLTAPDRPAQRFGTADFTVEGWLYLAATGAARGIISKGTASTGWSVNVTSGNKLQFSYTASNLTGTSSLSASTWYYFTAMRTGGSIRVYLNGTQEVTNSTTITDNFNQTNILYVGADRVGGSALNGYIDDLRVTNGYARYNNFTVPSAALTPTAYTAALPNTSTTNGAQNNTFLDGSTNNFTITRNGNTTQGTFSPFSNSGWSNFFDGTGDYLSVADNTALNMGSSDFTIESWVYANSATTGAIVDKDGTSAVSWSQYLLHITSGGKFEAIISTTTTSAPPGSPSARLTGTTTVQVGTWYHVAVTRVGTNATLWVNGVSEATSSTVPATLNTRNQPTTVGTNNNAGTGAVFFNGYLSNARIVKGTAVYTANFTPPTAPLTAITNTSLLTCQSNRFIDNSTNAFAITRNGDVSIQAFSPFTPAAYSSSTNGGSGYFDGTGDYLSIADSATIRFGTGNFTIQAWIYRAAAGVTHTIAAKGGASTGWVFQVTSTNVLRFTDTTTNIDTTTTILASTWTHVAVVRSGTGANQLKLYINAVDSATGTSSTDFNQTEQLNIGADRGNANTMNGYISSLKYNVGTAETITVPTAPLTGGTVLLNYTNAGIYDAVGINNYETVGNAQASTTQAKFGTTSMYFDGTGDWLTAPDRPVNQLRAGDFTVEGWFYLSAINVAYGIVSKGTSTTGWSVNITSGNKLQFSYTSSNLTGATTLAASTWYHFAVVRSGGTVQIYLNGVQDAISSVAITTDFNQTNILYIGADRVGGSAMNGYLDDIRITPGQALYPGNFTPPTAPFPNN